VSPYELEAVLRTHPAVRDVGVVSVAHPELGRAAHAVVELTAPGAAGPAELLAHVDARVTPALRVHSVEFTDRLPRTPSGKIRRSALTPAPSSTASCTDDLRGDLAMNAATLVAPALNAALLNGALPSVFRGIADRMDAEELDFQPLTADGRNGVEIHRLYTTEQTGPQGPAAGIVRYAPGAATVAHHHNGFEIIHVLEGQMEFGDKEYPAGSMLVMEPGSEHAPRSAGGALMLVVWEEPVSAL